ncbi:hypothetical protein LXA43DRAFT_609760 [Ganoderma leucocontextum]|nr:hypothetical protein LXA43DRAFT_609760 [Ganoderma leucocontextum]
MSGLLLVPFITMMLLVSRIPGAAAQGTNATCNSGFDWMTNSKGQSPCLVSSWLFTPCSSPSDSFVYSLTPGFHYNTPLNTTESAVPCRCNTVLFSTIAACATCQGGANDIVPWLLYSQNCSTPYIQKYPENIPSGTAIPAWAYLDVRINNTFDPAAAQAVAAQDLPESTAPAAASQTSLSTGTDGNIGAPTATGGDPSSSSKKTSNAGAIVGGVVGGIAGLALISLAVAFILRYRRSHSDSAPGGKHGQQPESPYTNYSTSAPAWEKSPVTSVSTHRLYDPNDPRTFPAQDPYASGPAVPAYTGYLPAMDHDSIGAVNGTSNDGYHGSGVTKQSSYRGAPEV